ncbi:MAG: glycosyltransferase [Chitinophagaceae bacterium]|nr:glycosyltransferase [Chitinophagaceae bacterium]
MNQDKKPWVSFCMSTFRRPVFLKNTLQTILRQTFTDFEIVVSDNDPDGSAEPVVREINDPRIRYFHNVDNLGMIKSFNKSIERSSAGFIVMITDDDPVYPDLLETFRRMHEQYPGYGMYLGGCDWFCTAPAVSRLYKLKVGTNSCLSDDYELGHTQALTGTEFLKMFFTFKLFPHYLWSTCMVSREILLKSGGVPDYGTPFLGDYAYLGIISSHAGCVFINKSLGCQTMHIQNFGRNQNEQIAIAAKRFPEYVEQHVAKVDEWPLIREQMNRFTAIWVVSHLSFLYFYMKEVDLRPTEKEVFSVPLMKKYRVKYFLKTRIPFLHDAIVKGKKWFSN